VVTPAGFWVAEEYAELLDEQAEGGRLPGMAAHPNGTGSNLADRQRLLPGACRVRKPWTVFTHTSRAARVLCSERASSGFPPDVHQAAQVIAVKFPRIEL